MSLLPSDLMQSIDWDGPAVSVTDDFSVDATRLDPRLSSELFGLSKSRFIVCMVQKFRMNTQISLNQLRFFEALDHYCHTLYQASYYFT